MKDQKSYIIQERVVTSSITMLSYIGANYYMNQSIVRTWMCYCDFNIMVSVNATLIMNIIVNVSQQRNSKLVESG